MRIAILGGLVHADAKHEKSTDPKWTTRNEEEFAAACADIGLRLCSHGHELVVASDHPGTADCHAVEGAEKALVASRGKKGAVSVIRPEWDLEPPEEKRTPFADLVRRYDDRVHIHRWGPSTPEFLKLMVIRNADAVVCLGGAEKTYFAGIAGAVSGKRVIPVGYFGGAGAELSRLFSSPGWGDHMPGVDVLRTLDNWGRNSLTTLLAALRAETVRIFIVHGRSEDRKSLEDVLNRLGKQKNPGVEVIVMAKEQLTGLTIPDAFERTAENADAAIVLATPDDKGGLADSKRLSPRVRQNVLLEFGWFRARLGGSSVLLLKKGESLDIPSDMHGLWHTSYSEDPSEAADKIRDFLQSLPAKRGS